MPVPKLPPKGIMASGTVTALAGGSYNSFTKGFTYHGNSYRLTVERQTGGSACVEWTHCSTTEASTYNNPQAKMSSSTWDVVHNGSYDTQTDTYSYNNDSYEVRMEELNGELYATAVKV